jgi:hypothetical protein
MSKISVGVYTIAWQPNGSYKISSPGRADIYVPEEALLLLIESMYATSD